MRSKKTYIILFIFLFTFFAIMFGLFGIKNIKQSSLETILIIGENDTTVWKYSNKAWSLLETKSSLDKLNWNTFQVYSNNKKIGKYQLWHDDKWYAFDDKQNAISIDGDLLAYSSNYNIKITDFNEEEIDDRTYVDEALIANNLSKSSQFTSFYKTSLDFDMDGKKEDFYILSNVFPEEFEPDTLFSLVFMVKDEKIYYLYRDIQNNHSLNGCKPYFTSFLDADNDNNYEIILSCARYSTSKPIHMLYSFKNNEFNIIISSQ